MRFKKYIEKFNPEQILELNKSGLNIKEIAEIVDIPAKRLAEMIKAFNLDIKKGSASKINENFFDIIDTEEKAYLLGFFVADGYMQKEKKTKNGEVYSYSYRFGITNSIDDLNIIELFRKFICPNKELEFSNRQIGVKNRKTQVTIRWTSKHMFETLESYNIHPRKTYDNNFYLPKILPQNLIRHFIRGYFDGDGHKGKSDVEFCINSMKFGKQIINYFNKFNYRVYEIKGKTCIYYKLYITGGEQLLNWVKHEFYDNANFYLERKYILFNPEVNIETKESISPQSVETEPLSNIKE